MHFGTVTYLLAGVALAQTIAIWRIATTLRSLARVSDRVSRFAEALALLTDTTEAGLANVANELERSNGRRASRGAARSATKRITTAARRGRSLEEIAATEGLSESEVRLHLHMTGDEVAKGALDGALRV